MYAGPSNPVPVSKIAWLACKHPIICRLEAVAHQKDGSSHQHYDGSQSHSGVKQVSNNGLNLLVRPVVHLKHRLDLSGQCLIKHLNTEQCDDSAEYQAELLGFGFCQDA